MKNGEYKIASISGSEITYSTIENTVGTISAPIGGDFSVGDTLTITGADTERAGNPDLTIMGNGEIGGTLTIKGEETTRDRVTRIENILGVTPHNVDLEAKYSDLQEAGERMDRALSEINSNLVKAISSIVDEYIDFAGQCEIMEKLKSNNGEAD